MKLAIFAVLALSLLVGCASNPALPQTPQQILAQVNTQVCPVVTAAISVIPQLDGISVDAKTEAAKAGAKVTAVCAQISAVTGHIGASDLEDLAKNALPTVLGILMAVPDPNPTVVAAKNAILIGQALLPVLIAQIKAAQGAATSAATSAATVAVK